MAIGHVVSVIMTVLNGEPFIEEAIASVFGQTYGSWELVLVDDGSSDGTPAIARDLAQRHPDRIRVLEHPGHANRGTSASRNLGIAAARGDYIALLDADDIYLPTRLARHVALLRAYPDADMVQSDTLRWYSWSDAAASDVRVRFPFDADALIRAPAMLRRSFDYLPRDGYFPSVCSVTFRRAVIEEIGGFDPGFAICEDWVFFSKLYLHKNVYVTTDVVAKYRKHRNSTLQRAQAGDGSILSPQFRFNVAYLRWLGGYLEQQKAADPALIARARRQLWPDESSVLSRVLGLPPALGLAARTTGIKRLISVGLPHPLYERLLRWWRALQTTKKRLIAISRS